MTNPKASRVAAELRRLADSLDRFPDLAMPPPHIFFSCTYRDDEKTLFLNMARLLPRPLDKDEDGPNSSDRSLSYKNDAIFVRSYLAKSKLCELVEPARPAVYRCVPLLSEEEEASLEASHD